MKLAMARSYQAFTAAFNHWYAVEAGSLDAVDVGHQRRLLWDAWQRVLVTYDAHLAVRRHRLLKLPLPDYLAAFGEPERDGGYKSAPLFV